MSQRLQVVLEEEEDVERPSCLHGPAILFREREVEFFACPQYRDRLICGFRMNRAEWQATDKEQLKRINIRTEEGVRKQPEEMKNKKHFCKTCGLFLRGDETAHSRHEVMRKLSPKDVRSIEQCPSRFLALKEDDKGEAQYIFSEKTELFFTNLLHQMHFTKILCIGAPSIHAALCKREDIQSFLLDIDERYGNFYSQETFAKFNMFNFYFFENASSAEQLEKFLKLDEEDRVAIFLDPPFGCRTELLGQTLRKIQEMCGIQFHILTIFLILPYFMETYVTNEMPQLEMMDYRVNYENHASFQDGGGRFGSPVRIFTNALPSLMKLPTEEGYRECGICCRWVGEWNSHCSICQKCPSKNGGSYRHCDKCGLCVKDFYKHCNTCNRCTQASGHKCAEYAKNASCWICRERGHLEKSCPRRKRKAKISSHRVCGICLRKNHSELLCKRRKTLGLSQ
ncbi:rRNA N6-adenosine-methyltransferase ZCCHC4 [Phlebotomus argentipes]|uniref:rRNA N6-adenosine-methyltransferase ZCCHC4 n=1 Tax=Phlebotomus argentipes TaxID=94469 RepID=UPI002892AE2E|nr:rRNA N6-adenosine-methyltransferase ZCCHC4 [Phlebotomus argentipes]